MSGSWLAVGPTVAPTSCPSSPSDTIGKTIHRSISNIQELKADFMLSIPCFVVETDAGIAISDNIREGVLEIPLYTEKFYVYLAESCWRQLPVFEPENLEYENMWIMKEAQYLATVPFVTAKRAARVIISLRQAASRP